MSNIYNLLSDDKCTNYSLTHTVCRRVSDATFSDLISPNDIIRGFYYKKPMRFKHTISPNIMGAGIQTLFSLLCGTFEPSELLTNCLSDYNPFYDRLNNRVFKQIGKILTDYDFCYFSLEYSNILGCARAGKRYRPIPKCKFDDGCIGFMFDKIENILRYKEDTRWDILYDEVGFMLYHKYDETRSPFTNKPILTYSKCKGDLDYITTDGILDFKCVRSLTGKSISYIAQQLAYLIMGKYGYNNIGLPKEYFNTIKNVICYNPINGEEIVFPVKCLKDEEEFIKRLFIECYEEGDYVLGSWLTGREHKYNKEYVQEVFNATEQVLNKYGRELNKFDYIDYGFNDLSQYRKIM